MASTIENLLSLGHRLKQREDEAKVSIAVQTIAASNSDPNSQEQITQLQKKTHELRLVNMELRHEQTKLRNQVSSLKEKNRDLKGKIE